ncbi:MAG: hypothetical protein ACXVPN_10395 [Bacteroidia bacterium]
MNIKDFWVRQLFKANKIIGVDIQVSPEGNYLFSYLALKRNGNNLSIIGSKEGIQSIEELLPDLAKINCPIILSVNGKGVISKNLNGKFSGNYQEALLKMLPSGNEQEFHIQLFHGFADSTSITLIRREAINELISYFSNAKLNVIDVVLGMYVTEILLPFLNEPSSLQKIELSNGTILFEDGRLKEVNSNISESLTQVNFGGESVDSGLLLPLSSAISYFTGFSPLSHNNAILKEVKNETEYKKAFTTLAGFLIGFLFLLSAGNAVIFNKYFDKKTILDSELMSYQGSLQTYEKLKNQLNEKRDFLDKSGLLQGSKASFIADRLLYDLPDQVQLTYFNMFPYTNISEGDSVPDFDNKKILVRGIATKSILINEWMKLLKSKDFVQDVILENYNQESKAVNCKFDLVVKLK